MNATIQTPLLPARLPLPDFPALTNAGMKSDIEALLVEAFGLLNQANHIPSGGELDFIHQLEAFENRLHQVWSVLSNLNATCNTPELRETYNALLPELSRYYTEQGQNKALYQAYLTIQQQADFATLAPARQEAIRLALRDFKLSGVALEGEAKTRYAAITERLSQLSSQFSDHLLDATQAYQRPLSKAELAGLPESAVALVQQMAKQKATDDPSIEALATLDAPVFIAISTYADDRALRAELYRAYTTRASELAEVADAKAQDNSAIIEEILALRLEMAQLLGFTSYAELSLASKMAPDVATVREFLVDIATKAQAAAHDDLAELRAEGARIGLTDIQPWDTAYLAEKVKQRKYNLSQETLKPYFPAHVAISGLFQVAKRLYGIEIEQRSAPVWANGVQYYEISEQGQVIAGFYFDLYARTGKRGGAWMSGFRPRMQTSQGLQLPVAFMVGNFTPPVDGKPALLSHDELVTLFHEFGHGLHHMLTEVDVISVSGINGVAWDAVELPSQFLEFWTWEPDALALVSQHHETSESLPTELLDAMLAARHFQSGMQALRQIEFSLFDLDIHHQSPAPDIHQVQAILDNLRQQFSVLPPPAYNRFQHGFSHIFAGGYAAGYYSYKWAEVLASDAFDRFEQEGIFNVETGHAFRQHVLAAGGSKTALETFRNFRGRDASIDALLRHNGWSITTTPAVEQTT
ncbi:M3 family metallopeptidase [Aquirhabdus parva]|uniref:oligopeptidase A n=1 Tax=Aquirhabdus parva TaxID=2283318 RepID=A0A345P2Y2_9GAMM|nr:M3 family metallopeptidase [Aquirhabdus parva]AXI01641.1 M3 family peptidase [Aquirhabdus parva]